MALEEEKTEEVKEDVEGIAPADVTYREINHLAYVVWSVDSNTSVVPKGSFSVDQAGRLVENSSFAGLSASDAQSLSSFFHFRNPQARASPQWQTLDCWQLVDSDWMWKLDAP